MTAIDPGDLGNPFIEHPAERQTLFGGDRYKFTFGNGYGASVVRHSGSYGAEDGLWEVAVLGRDGRLCYDTPVTNDIIGHLPAGGVEEVLRQIAELPAGRTSVVMAVSADVIGVSDP